MRLLRLQLFDYRNFHRLDVELPSGPLVFLGDNAQGKTNLLEAVCLLATMQSPRAESDLQMIRRESLEDDVLPAARVSAAIESQQGASKIEVIILARPGSQGLVAGKTVRLNSVPKRLSAAVGRLMAVSFSADDLEIVSGAPSTRRRYLDQSISQWDRDYATARQRFERVLLQRNHLLKRIREGEARIGELAFWDEELSRDGGYLLYRRALTVHELDALSRQAQLSLAPGERLAMTYRPSLDKAQPQTTRWESPQFASEVYACTLKNGLQRDVAAGMTLHGPHRDDALLMLDGVSASGYASRAQQRTIALALRLAEARLLLERRGEPPVLLLDDVLSEMDPFRRSSVLSALQDYEQALITGSDPATFPADFLAEASVFSVNSGSIQPLAAGGAREQGRAQSRGHDNT